MKLPVWFWLGFLLAGIVSYLGMALFRKGFRIMFLAVFLVPILIAVVGGMNIITGPEVFFADVSTFLAGFAIALSYYTELNEQFY